MLVSLVTFIIEQTTLAGYVPALKRTRKSKKKIRQSKRVERMDQEDNYKLGEGSVFTVRAGLDHFLVNMANLEFLSLLTFIYKMT